MIGILQIIEVLGSRTQDNCFVIISLLKISTIYNYNFLLSNS